MWATVAPKGLSLSCFNGFFIDKQISLMASNWARAYSGFALGCLAWHREYLYGEPAPASGGTCIHLCVFTHQAWALADQEALANPSLQSAANSGELRHHHVCQGQIPAHFTQLPSHGEATTWAPRVQTQFRDRGKVHRNSPTFLHMTQTHCFTLSNRSSPFSK